MASSNKIRKVLISDSLDAKCAKILEENGIETTTNTKLDKEGLVREIEGYDGLIVRSATKVTREVIEAGKNLKIIGRAGTGVDNIDCEAATQCGVIVMNTPGGNTISAAEHTCALICCMSRNIAEATASVKQGKWERGKFAGNELLGKTLAIVGLGRIGREVASRMQSFGMTTIGFDPLVSAEESSTFDVKWLALDEIWPIADYITVHVPLIKQTKDLINDEVLTKCKRGVRLLNVARGGIIDEVALLAALQDGRCHGAALDVYTEEPPVFRELLDHPKLVCTPHLGASTAEAQQRVAEEIAQQFADFSQGKALFGAINAGAVSSALSKEMAPLVSLAKNLGKFAAAASVGIQDAGVRISGWKGGKDFLPAAFLVGFLGMSNANLINSINIASTKGISVCFKEMDSNESLEVFVKLSDGRPITLSGRNAGTNSCLFRFGNVSFENLILAGNILFSAGGLAEVLDSLKSKAQNVSSVVCGEAPSGGGDPTNFCAVSLNGENDFLKLAPKGSFLVRF